MGAHLPLSMLLAPPPSPHLPPAGLPQTQSQRPATRTPTTWSGSTGEGGRGGRLGPGHHTCLLCLPDTAPPPSVCPFCSWSHRHLSGQRRPECHHLQLSESPWREECTCCSLQGLPSSYNVCCSPHVCDLLTTAGYARVIWAHCLCTLLQCDVHVPAGH